MFFISPHPFSSLKCLMLVAFHPRSYHYSLGRCLLRMLSGDATRAQLQLHSRQNGQPQADLRFYLSTHLAPLASVSPGPALQFDSILTEWKAVPSESCNLILDF